MTVNEISGEVVDAAMHVHSVLGPGLVESVYEACLAYELRKRGHHVLVQHPLPVIYEDVRLEAGYRLDLLVDGTILVEIKSVAKLAPIHLAITLTYLRLSRVPVGLIINFGVVHLRDGIRRVIGPKKPF
jgi:GxxExxY protein